jgi:predicted nuclease with RNAse H fold
LSATTLLEIDAPAGVAVVSTYPAGVDDDVSAEWVAIAREITPVDVEWRLSVHAVCALAAD